MSEAIVQCSLCKACDPIPRSDAERPQAWRVCEKCRSTSNSASLEAVKVEKAREKERAVEELRKIAEGGE